MDLLDDATKVEKRLVAKATLLIFQLQLLLN